MKVLRERDVPSEKYTNVFFGYGPEQRGEYFSLELTYNYGVDSYDIGSGFGHFGIAVEDASAVVERVRSAGFKVTREVSPVIGKFRPRFCLVFMSVSAIELTEMMCRDQAQGGSMIIAFVEDPSGYKFAIIQRKQRDPLCQVMLRVRDLDASIKFYEAMGMKLLRKNENKELKCTLASMGFGAEEDSTTLELTHNWGENEYTAGTGYAQIAVSTPDVYETAKRFESLGIELARKPGPVPGIGTKICAVRDPDSWKTVLVDADDFEKEFE